MNDNRISAVINTYNAAATLEATLDTLRDFDEIVVCDMESTDATLDIARRYGCRIVTFPRGSHTICEPARDFAIHSATNPYVLVVDADELVQPALIAKLRSLVSEPSAPAGAFVPFLNKFMGRYLSLKPEYHLRFFRKDVTMWPPELHSVPRVDGHLVKLPAKEKELYILHDHDISVASHVEKCNRYTDLQADRRRNRRYGMISLLLKPQWAFFKTYILRGACRYGKRGVIMAYLDMMHHIIMLAKHFELNNQADERENRD